MRHLESVHANLRVYRPLDASLDLYNNIGDVFSAPPDEIYGYPHYKFFKVLGISLIRKNEIARTLQLSKTLGSFAMGAIAYTLSDCLPSSKFRTFDCASTDMVVQGDRKEGYTMSLVFDHDDIKHERVVLLEALGSIGCCEPQPPSDPRLDIVHSSQPITKETIDLIYDKYHDKTFQFEPIQIALFNDPLHV